MIASVKLYYNSNILPDRNFEIDNLPDYLTTLTKETIDNIDKEYFIKINSLYGRG